MNIRQIKEKYTCLDYLGKRVVKKTTTGYLAHCPWRADRHPSLSVTKDGKGWWDHASGEHGNIIDMIMKCLGTNDLSRVCAEFCITKIPPFEQSKILGGSKEGCHGFAFCDVVPLQSRRLYAYLSERCVDLGIAKQFLQEAHYSFQRQDGRYLTALAYANDKGGYELRGTPYNGNPKGFKGGTAPKWITTHHDRGNAPTVVFEGFLDMLSFATLCGGVRHNYVVLNSIVNAPAAIEVLRSISGKIYLALDNDPRGDDTTKQMLDALPGAVDIRSRFSPAKDVNDYLVKKN